MRSMASKSNYVGRVSGFGDGLDQNAADPDPVILKKVVESLNESAREQKFGKDVEQRHLQAAATLVEYTPSTTP